MTSHQRMGVDARAFLQVTRRNVHPTRRFTVPSAETHRLCRSTGLSNVPSFGSPARHSTTLKQCRLVGHRLVVDEALSFAGSERCPTGAFLISWRYQSKHLQAMLLEVRRHNLSRAGAYLKCTRVLDLENSALY